MKSPSTVVSTDLSSKARLRQSALELFAERGVDRSSIRHIAQHAGVAPGLVRHHYGNKQGLTRAVDDSVMELIERKLMDVPLQGSLLEISESRDQAFVDLLAENPLIAAYMRQVIVQPLGANDYELLDRLVDLTLDQTRHLMAQGMVPRGGLRRSAYTTVVRQIRRLVLDPTAVRVGDHLGIDVSGDAGCYGA